MNEAIGDVDRGAVESADPFGLAPQCFRAYLVYGLGHVRPIG